ncbi:MAG: tRNA (adenosine(37)-N6)-threonylcarbamoyltransferase complex transferase subunit TsaD [Holosporales bacterium]|jgi:N6-L-threonylcarbamoyladenine synthase|nr:tRNA (adenosine(37)-N6)-threonylcarbamoyltransferase complex transferase subunit TsaD [Holosporales bacterium]
MKILGIESSCDDTAAAVVTDDKTILSNVVYSQELTHKLYGGVVPEIAARAHIDKISDVVQHALSRANCSVDDIDLIAATAGPGLIGGLIVGTSFAKAMAVSLNKPYIPINHLEGHALTARLTNNVEYPYLLFLLSGGHCQSMIVRGYGDYSVIGRTLDDAIGESFDKAAKMLGLPTPGGPFIEKAALSGDPKKFKFSAPMLGRNDFSFSGLKTAVRIQVEKIHTLSKQDISDLSASFQQSICDVILDKLKQLLKDKRFIDVKQLVLGGGVGANAAIRSSLQKACNEREISLIAPPAKFCTDNAAMIAWAAVERATNGFAEDLEFCPNPNWQIV